MVCSYYGSNILKSMIFFCIAFVGYGGMGPGFISASLDIALKYTGVIIHVHNHLYYMIIMYNIHKYITYHHNYNIKLRTL